MASRGVNKVILIGNLGNDPEVRYMSNGEAMATANLATSEAWKDQQGVQQERTEWHRLVFYRKLAEIVGQYPKKGAKLYIEGSLRTRKWQDKSGQDRYTTEIVAHDMQMLDRVGGGMGGMGGGDPGPGAEPIPPAAARDREADRYPSPSFGGGTTAPRRDSAPTPSGGGVGMDDFDDDIPF